MVAFLPSGGSIPPEKAPPDGTSSAPGQDRPAGRDQLLLRVGLSGVALGGLATLLAVVMMHPANTGVHDWDYFNHTYEAIRLSVLDYGQFPWWDIWSCGGVPLFANPQAGVFSINALFALLFGTVLGLKLSLVCHMAVGFEGTRRLLRLYVSQPFALWGAFAFAGCGGMAMHFAVGHLNLAVIYYLPWLLFFVAKLASRRLAGWLFGLTMGLMVLESVHYFTAMVACVASIGAVCMLVAAHGRRWMVLSGIGTALGAFLILAGLRLGLSMWYVRQYSVTAREPITVLGRAVMDAFVLPINSVDHRSPMPGRGWWEYGCYLGWPVIVLFGASMFRRVRYWHVAGVLCVVLAAVPSPWNPSGWLAELPLLSAVRGLTRWRLVAALFIAMGAASGAAALWQRVRHRPWGMLLPGVCVAATVMIIVVSARTLSQGFVGPAPPAVPPRSELMKEFFHIGPQENERRDLRLVFPATRLNRGVVEGCEGLLGYNRLRPNLVKARGEDGYLGEATAGGAAIEPRYWSPNRIVFEHVRGPLRVNLAPGSYWRVNGQDAFRNLRVTELTTPFLVTPDESGRVVLTIVPTGWRLGAGIVMMGVALVSFVGAAGLFASRRAAQRRTADGCSVSDPRA